MRFSCPRVITVATAVAVAAVFPAAASANVFGSLDETAPTASVDSSSGATIVSDKADYEPGQIVTLTGSGWQPGESVRIVVNDDGLQAEPWQRDVTVIANDLGEIGDSFEIAPWVVADYTVTASGELSGTASTAFTDSHTERGCGLAVTLVVNTTTDELTTNNGLCSLREAIIAANNTSHTIDTITLPSGTYTLTIPGMGESNSDTGDLDVNQPLTINGGGARTTVVQAGTDMTNGIDRVFHVQSSGALTLRNTTVRFGRVTNSEGGGIRSDRPLTLEDVTVANNTAGASSDAKPGGGIYYAGSTAPNLSITRAAISGNKAHAPGGGIWTSGNGTLTNVTINNNNSSQQGGGIRIESGTTSVTNVTVSGNVGSSGGGISRSGGTINLRNTIVAGNTGGATPNCSSGVTNIANNLDTGVGCFGAVPVNGSIANGSPQLGALQNNGGPTDTQALGAGSQALDAGTATSAPTNDQRSVTRPAGAAHDIGAYEGNASGLKFLDRNDDNARQANGADGAPDPAGDATPDDEVPLAGWTIRAYADNGAGGGDAADGTLHADETTVADEDTTPASGIYGLTLAAGSYVICERIDNRAGFVQTTPDNAKCADLPAAQGVADGGHSFTLATGGFVSNKDFGNREATTGIVSGLKFNDADRDGANADDPADPPLKDWVIEAYDAGSDGELDSTEAAATPAATDTTSDPDGTYELELEPGRYVICEQLDAGWVQTTPDPDDEECALVDGAGAGGHAVTVAAGDELTTGSDFGNYELASVSGLKFNDLDHNGSRDPDGADNDIGTLSDNEGPLEGWTINAYADDGGDGGDPGDGVLYADEVSPGPAASDDTDATGAYSLSLVPGPYVVCEEPETGWVQSAPSNANCEAVDVDAPGGHAVTAVVGTPATGNDFGNYEPATVSGLKFNDLDHDGSRDANGADDDIDTLGDNEGPLTGWTIEVYGDDGDGALDDTEGDATAVATTSTSLDGTYSFDLPSGDYVICEQLDAGWAQSAPDPADKECTEVAGAATGGHGVDLDPGEDLGGQNFGNHELATVSGLKFDDLDRNGSRDANGANDIADDADDEVGLEGWTIDAYADDGAGDGDAGDGVLHADEVSSGAAASDDTDATGAYSFSLAPGAYVVCEQLESGWVQSAPSNAKCEEVDVDAPGGHAVTAVAGTPAAGNDFGNYEPATVSGLKFNDLDHNGSRDADGADDDIDTLGDNEGPLAGWTIEAYADDGDGALDDTEGDAAAVASDDTGADGTYELTLPSGDYVICEQIEAGWAQSAPDPADKECTEVEGAATGGHAIDLDPGEDDTAGNDFGNHHLATIAGRKFDDKNRDGVRDPDGADDAAGGNDDEPLLEGWTIEVYADGGDGTLSAAEGAADPLATTTTDSAGAYSFAVPSGDYVICEQLTSGWAQHSPANTTCATASGAAAGGHAVIDAPPGGSSGNRNFANYRTANIAVSKTYSDVNNNSVSVTMTCEGGSVQGGNTKTVTPGTPSTFTVNGFAAGNTCDATESPVPAGYAQNDSDCQDVALGTKTSCTIQNVKSSQLVTAGGCTFDRDTSRTGNQFPLIFTPDGGSTSKLTATNPGQFFMNSAYGGSATTMTIRIPYPFVTVGTNPTKVHSGVAVTTGGGKTCYSPSGENANDTDQVNWNWSTATFGQTQTITVPVQNGFAYARTHLAYGLRGVAGGCAKGAQTPPTATCSLPMANFAITGYKTYPFAFTAGSGGGSSQIESFNEFKKNPGIGGLVIQNPGAAPVANAKVEIWQGTTKKATVYTDVDGWYLWAYKYTGKAATFTVKLPDNGNVQQTVTLKSNGYLTVNFTL